MEQPVKTTHYQNIGFPKCGTSWLYGRFGNMHDVTKLGKENFWQERSTNEHEFKINYIDHYSSHDITFNFNTQTYTLPIEKKKKVHEYTTHLTMIIRNPWELMESWYNYAIVSSQEKEYIGTLDTNLMFDFPKVFQNWSFSQIPVKVMLYDDLCDTPIEFVKEICKYTSTRYKGSVTTESILRWYESINKTVYTKSLPLPNKELINLINNRITETELITGRNLNHWKK